VPIYDLNELGAILRRRRQALALTQGEAAGVSGVSLRLWSEVERGERPNVSFTTALRMLNTIGLDLEVRERRP
jgi:transcriptional regulator with XRE-family HTH domain